MPESMLTCTKCGHELGTCICGVPRKSQEQGVGWRPAETEAPQSNMTVWVDLDQDGHDVVVERLALQQALLDAGYRPQMWPGKGHVFDTPITDLSQVCSRCRLRFPIIRVDTTGGLIPPKVKDCPGERPGVRLYSINRVLRRFGLVLCVNFFQEDTGNSNIRDISISLQRASTYDAVPEHEKVVMLP